MILLLYINYWKLGFLVSWRILVKILDSIYFLNIIQHDPTSLYQLLRIRFSCIMKNFSQNFEPYLFCMHHVSWLFFSIPTLENLDFMYHEDFTVKFWSMYISIFGASSTECLPVKPLPNRAQPCPSAPNRAQLRPTAPNLSQPWPTAANLAQPHMRKSNDTWCIQIDRVQNFE